jgi:hypothetical protein
LISAFVIFHLTATLVWVFPTSPVRLALEPVVRPYMLPLGLWQSWWMFAPDPMRVTATLESEVIDAKGMRHLFEFPKVAELPWWQKLPRFRHPKFTCNLMVDEYKVQREFTARHVVRQLRLRPEAFPVHVSLYCQIKEPPLPGQRYSNSLATPRLQAVGTFDFASPEKVLP